MSSNFYAAVTIILWGAMPALTKDLLNALPNFETLTLSSLFAFLFLFGVNYRQNSFHLPHSTFQIVFTAACYGLFSVLNKKNVEHCADGKSGVSRSDTRNFYLDAGVSRLLSY